MKSVSADTAPIMSGRKSQYRENTSNAAFIILSLFFVMEYLRPQDGIMSFLSVLKIPMLLTITLFIVFLKSDNKAVIKDKIIILSVIFLMEIAISIVYATNTYYVWRVFKGMALMMIVVMAMPVVLDSLEKVKRFYNLMIIIYLFLAIYIVLHAGQGPGGFVIDENDASLVLDMAVPMAFVMVFQKNITITRKLFYLAVTVLLVTGVIASMSRGGFVGFAAVVVFFWWLTKNRFKTLLKALFIVALLGYPVYQMVPDSYKHEVESISDTSDSTRNERFFSWGLAVDMFADNPVLGVGAMNYGWNVARYQMMRSNFDPDGRRLLGGREAHSLYFTLISELGIIGIFLYIAMVYYAVKKLRYIIRQGEQDADLYDAALMAKGLLASMVAYFVAGAFISVLYYPVLWYLFGITIALKYSVDVSRGGDQLTNMDGLSEKRRRNLEIFQNASS